MLVRFHLSYGSFKDAFVPGMNDFSHVVNTLRSRGYVYVNNYKDVVMEQHVMHMEELEEPEVLEEELNKFEKLHPTDMNIHYSPEVEQEAVELDYNQPWHPGRG